MGAYSIENVKIWISYYPEKNSVIEKNDLLITTYM